MNHTCQVRIRKDWDAEDEDLPVCLGAATKQLGRIWMCDEHYDTFKNAEGTHLVTFACDCKGIPSEDE